MSTERFAYRLVAILLMAVMAADPGAMAAEIGGSKDDLFAYPGILEQADNGAFLKIDYDKMRDIHKRDDDPERRVKGQYVSTGVRWYQDFETIETGGRAVDVFQVGKLKAAKFAVIFVHGRGGDRKLGANDYSFGGNFNRLKNLAAENGGVYYAPSVRSFDDAGVTDIAGLIAYAQQQSPGKPVVLACASMGSFICWGMTRNPQAVAALNGMMIMGGPPDPAFRNSAAYKKRLPMFFSHGSADSVYAAADQVALYRSLKASNYPSRFVLFQTGSHGTPVRMTDWRDALNWIGVD